MASVVTKAEQPEFSQLNQLDSAEQQRQKQYQQAQQKQNNSPVDMRLDISSSQSLSLSNHEYPCYPIH